MSETLRGLRVLDLSRGPAGGLATMILADFGAEVLCVAPPGDDELASLPAAPLWRRGKQRVELDIHSKRDEFEALCAAADVLVISWRPSALRRADLHFEALHERHPHLNVCHVSAFGSSGPRAEYPGYEHVAAAVTGRMIGFSGVVDREGPVFSALQVGVHATAQSAVTGILAAELARPENGEGRLIETSLLQGMLPYEQGATIGIQFPDRFGRLYGLPFPEQPPLPSLYYHPAQAGDGRWMQFGNLLPHLFDNFLMVTDLMDVVADPEWNGAQMMLPKEKHEAFRERMLLQVQSRPSKDWMADCIANGSVVATTYQTTQEALVDPDIVANGHVIERDEGGVQLGPVARLTKTPATPGAPIADGTSRAAAWSGSPRTATTTAPSGLPLAGIKVVEIATIIAAPFGASFLADMGAEVIKVEQIGGDPYRGLGLGVGSARVNAGKQSISLNLKSEAGKEIVLKLIADADVLIHNYRPGVPERLGIGYDDVAKINPGIVYLQSNGYGPDGPGALRPSTHPIPGAAMGGVMYQMGERAPTSLQDPDGLRLWTSRLMRANEVNPDPNTAMVVATSVLLGLNARKRTGEGQRVLVDMFGANAYANHDDFLDYPGKPGRYMPDELGYGLSGTYRLYEAAEGSWVFLALVSERDRERFESILGEECPALTENELANLFKGRTADEWEALFAPQGVGCVRADRQLPPEFWLQDEDVLARGLNQLVTHPAWGDYRRHGANVTFDGEQPELKPPPTAGQDAPSLLSALGYSSDDISRFETEGVIFRE